MMSLGRKVFLVSLAIIFLWVMCVMAFIYRSNLQFASQQITSRKPLKRDIELCKSQNQKLKPGFWQKVNHRTKSIPQSVKDSLPLITVKSGSVTVQSTKVHYLYAEPMDSNNNIPVLLLHGQSYTSETWNELGTIKILAALGFYPVAIDLPGFGKSPAAILNKSDFIHDFITSLNLKKPVLVSPSMSGTYSFAYLIKHPGEVGGFIPVAPVRSNILSATTCKEENNNTKLFLNEDCAKVMALLKSDDLKMNCFKVPTLNVWGEKDRNENSARLCLLPEGQGAEIPGGKHAAYLSNPDLWHNLLYSFLKLLDETQACR